jgi:hypothetical protein
VQPGDTFTFQVPLKEWAGEQGNFHPIVSLETDGHVFLDFQTGKANAIALVQNDAW